MPRSDAARNREKILAVARDAFASSSEGPSMAEVSRRAGVGMATLYRNFPSRRELLEALYVDEVDAICAPPSVDGTPGEVFLDWVQRFVAFTTTKHPIATELLRGPDADETLLHASRHRVLAAGRPLLAAAQAAGEVREDLSLEQVLDLVMSVGAVRGDDAYRAPILRAVLDGLRRAPTGRVSASRRRR